MSDEDEGGGFPGGVYLDEVAVLLDLDVFDLFWFGCLHDLGLAFAFLLILAGLLL